MCLTYRRAICSRAHLSGETDLGRQVKDILASGNLVPDSITNQMVAERLMEDDVKDGALLDGFPRNMPQAAWLDGYLAARSQRLAGVVVLMVPEDELKERLKGRALKQGRSDDADPAVIQNRIDTYRAQSEPCLAYYRDQGLVPVHEVDGLGSIDEVRDRMWVVRCLAPYPPPLSPTLNRFCPAPGLAPPSGTGPPPRLSIVAPLITKVPPMLVSLALAALAPAPVDLLDVHPSLGPYTEIQDAVLAAHEGDVIRVAPATTPPSRSGASP